MYLNFVLTQIVHLISALSEKISKLRRAYLLCHMGIPMQPYATFVLLWSIINLTKIEITGKKIFQLCCNRRRLYPYATKTQGVLGHIYIHISESLLIMGVFIFFKKS